MPTRMSRPQSQAQTRARLIESAATLYLRDGYAATSNNQVAEAAGYSRGAVYSNFASKEDLALAVLDKHTAEEFEAVRHIMATGTVAERITALRTWMAATIQDPQWALFKAELAFAARHSRTLPAQLAERDQNARRELTELIEQVTAELEVAVPIRPQVLAGLILALGKGIAIDCLVEPAEPQSWIDEIFTLVEPLLTLLAIDPSADRQS
ncbi:TetR/AcrR family transcriptional regulator [Nocardia sp. NPDC020380]|uniref:TetR/AcrR family transcriptional regulator n=1 Tax=Nocardia sp. NPDC020380 TaxID=3364309 RepID=UPI0037A2B35E